jgi:SAM-dependent methyltransferase
MTARQPAPWLQPPDTAWFDANPDAYLDRSDFRAFEATSGVRLRHLCSADPNVVRRVQLDPITQSVIGREINAAHGSCRFPFLAYTQCFAVLPPPKRGHGQVDRAVLRLDMTDSLRRRHIALSYAVLPSVVRSAYEAFQEPLTVANLGSGVGLDVLNAALRCEGLVREAINVETDPEAVSLGRRLVEWLVGHGRLGETVVSYIEADMLRVRTKAHVVAMVGVICPLTDAAAVTVLRSARRQLVPRGLLVVSSSNHNMRCTDPLASFLIQHLGSKDDPLAGWGLNFRTQEQLRDLLEKTGFDDIRIWHDADYPGRDEVPPEIASGVDPLPARVFGHDPVTSPVLPDPEVLARRMGYNWIAVARKP